MGGIVSCFSNLLVTAEKLSLWISCTVLICCLITTITIILGLGIGLGYNYCFTDMITRYRYAHYIGSPRWPYPVADDETRWGPQPPKVNIKPKIRKNAPYSLDTTRKSTVITTITTTSTPPTTTTILTTTVIPTESDNDYYNDPGSLPNDPGSLPNDTGSSSNDPGSSPNDPRLLTNDPEYPAHGKFNLVSPKTDLYYLSNKKLTTDNVAENNWIDMPDDETRNNLEKVTNRNWMPTASVRTFVPDDDKKTVVPLSDLDLISLLSKIRADGKNYTLQIVT